MKIPKQHKKNTKEEREIIQNAFMDCRNFFLDTQIPCLLTMDIITESKSRMTEGEFLSYKAYVQDVLDGWRPPLGLEVIKGGKE
jgi:hypothetical protein